MGPTSGPRANVFEKKSAMMEIIDTSAIGRLRPRLTLRAHAEVWMRKIDKSNIFVHGIEYHKQ